MLMSHAQSKLWLVSSDIDGVIMEYGMLPPNVS